MLQHSFDLMFVSKFTRTLKCYISFFPDFCLFQDLMTKQIIGTSRESGGLYILDPTVSKPIAYSGVTTPFETHCQLGHLSLPLLPNYHSGLHSSQNPLISRPPPDVLTSDPVPDDDLPIALRKDRRQCVHPISSFCTYNQLSSRSCSYIGSLDSISLPNTF